MRCHLMVKHDFSSCSWKRYHALFLLIWCVATNDRWFVTGDHFFFFFYLLEKVYVYSLFIWFFNFSPYVFLLHIFVIGPFIKKIYVFNLVLKLQFVIYYFFQFGLYYFDFLLFSLLFNFIPQLKFMLFYFFRFSPHSFDLFFLMLNYLSFQFKPPI
jgi:hypothetical protein